MNKIIINFAKTALFAFSLGFFAVALTLLTGCGTTKTRSVELSGMYTNAKTGVLGIGVVDIMSAPQGEESATLKYSEDTAWLSPSTKTHEIKIMLTGTNSIEQTEKIVSHICHAFGFVAVQPTNAPSEKVELPIENAATTEGEVPND